jgi:Fe2+ transport system protein FeoA
MAVTTARKSLATLPTGASGPIAAIREEYATELAREGLQVGVEVGVEAAAPFGGPLIVRVGRARIAIARRVAGTIEVIRPAAGAE